MSDDLDASLAYPSRLSRCRPKSGTAGTAETAEMRKGLINATAPHTSVLVEHLLLKSRLATWRVNPVNVWSVPV